MRNPERIDVFTSELNRIWKTYYYNWHFGQFMFNFRLWLQNIKKIDEFYLNELEMIAYLKEFCGEGENDEKE